MLLSQIISYVSTATSHRVIWARLWDPSKNLAYHLCVDIISVYKYVYLFFYLSKYLLLKEDVSYIACLQIEDFFYKSVEIPFFYELNIFYAFHILVVQWNIFHYIHLIVIWDP